MKRLLVKTKQLLCRHKLDIIYSSHYPTIYCKKCGKYLLDEVNTKLARYVDKINKDIDKE